MRSLLGEEKKKRIKSGFCVFTEEKLDEIAARLEYSL
jgi:hypothetical protein